VPQAERLGLNGSRFETLPGLGLRMAFFFHSGQGLSRRLGCGAAQSAVGATP